MPEGSLVTKAAWFFHRYCGATCVVPCFPEPRAASIYPADFGAPGVRHKMVVCMQSPSKCKAGEHGKHGKGIGHAALTPTTSNKHKANNQRQMLSSVVTMMVAIRGNGQGDAASVHAEVVRSPFGRPLP